ncbi:hypothetical protein J3R83DRAFT_860 [Lanmaoa asiatica]|nr:hypothetical protein J3R83DRAFT_860 [Lanmaoa asiatica]
MRMPTNPPGFQNFGQAGPGQISLPSPNNRTATRYGVERDASGESTYPDVDYPSSFHVPMPPLPPLARRNLIHLDNPLESQPAIADGTNQEALRPQATPVQNTQQPSYSSSSTLNDGGSDGDIGAFAKKFETKNEDEHLDEKYALASHEHPYDILPPQPAYDTKSVARPKQPNKVSFAEDAKYRDEGNFDAEAQAPTRWDDEGGLEDVDVDSEPNYCEMNDRDGRRKGIVANLMDFYGVTPGMNGLPYSRSQAYEAVGKPPGRPRFGRNNSNASDSDTYSEILDPDDPRVTNITKRCLDDYEDERRNALRQMDYRQRRKEQQRIRIEFNVTSILKRHQFLLKLARALMTFGAPSHRIESQLVAAARILEINAEFIHLPSVIICCFGDNDTMTSETHFVKGSGGLALGNLHKVHLVYRAVLHDEISARKATQQLEELLSAEPLYSIWFRCVLSFFLSVLICPLAFGGSFLDMWIAGGGAFVLCFLQLNVATKSTMYNNVFECVAPYSLPEPVLKKNCARITTAMFMSFTARGLSSIRSQIFCYEAISSAGIIGILPGFLILTSSLELASKNIVCGSVKMVYALIYTLFLGFGLQIGSDLYLLFDPTARHHLATLAAKLSTTITLIGTFAPDSSTDGTPPANGTFTFTNATNVYMADIVGGCYRPSSFAWFIQPFPWWTQFVIVPVFSVLSSLSNLQPWKSKELPVMVIISCASYATNKIANHYIFNRSDIVSAIGAFTVGLLGNIYSRKMGGTAFTSMVTGVLFLVPSGLSQAGGITANGSAVDVGSAMIAVTIGITVGLFMSQAIVYMFGSRKNAAVFSF